MSERVYINNSNNFGEPIHYLDTSKPIGFDMETTAKEPWDGKISLIQMSDGETTVIVDVLAVGTGGALDGIRDLVESKAILKIAHNAKFEMKWLMYHLGVEPEMFYDTMLASQIIAAGQAHQHNLGEVGYVFLGERVDKSEQKSDWSARPLSAEQIDYAAFDAEVVIPIYEEQVPRLVADDLLLTATIDFDAIRPIARTENNGMHLDAGMWRELLERKQAELAVLKQEMLDLLGSGVDWTERNPAKVGKRPTKPKKPVDPRRAKANKGREISQAEIQNYELNLQDYQWALVEWQKEFEKWEKLPDEVPGVYNPNSVPQTKRLLKNVTGIEFESTRDDFLEEYSNHPEIAKLMEYRGAAKLVSSYGENILNALDVNSRLHTTFSQIKDTGRMGAKEPNLQQIPGDEEYRRTFTAPYGRKLIIADYSQIQLRILAEFAGDKNFVDDFNSGSDMHTQGASRFNRVPVEVVTKDMRTKAKRVNFGVIFAIGDNKLGRQLGIEWWDAGKLKKAYFNTYPANDAHLQLANIQARDHLFARTSSGRIQRFTHDGSKGQIAAIGRNGQNMPIQGTEADMLKRALYLIDVELLNFNRERGLTGSDRAMLVNIVHDEIVGEAPAEYAEAMKELMEEKMAEAGALYISRVDVLAEAAIADAWLK
jgi:DNA polymerase I-like protein with 3'-5' exonuclease and polymerase domains